MLLTEIHLKDKNFHRWKEKSAREVIENTKSKNSASRDHGEKNLGCKWHRGLKHVTVQSHKILFYFIRRHLVRFFFSNRILPSLTAAVARHSRRATQFLPTARPAVRNYVTLVTSWTKDCVKCRQTSILFCSMIILPHAIPKATVDNQHNADINLPRI